MLNTQKVLGASIWVFNMWSEGERNEVLHENWNIEQEAGCKCCVKDTCGVLQLFFGISVA